MLTQRENEVLALMAQGFRRAEIGQQLGLSQWTVADHSESLRFKLGARNTTHAVALGFRLGLLKGEEAA